MTPVHPPPPRPGHRLSRCGFILTGLGLCSLLLTIALLSGGAIRSALAAGLFICFALVLAIAGFITMVIAADPFADEEGVANGE